MQNLQPLADRILVKRDSSEEVTKSGLFIPKQAQEDKYFGTIKEVGPVVSSVKKGDHVLFERFGGDNITINDEDLVLLREENIVGLVTGTPEPVEV